ncbi:MAG: hypothetical protein KZQ58_08945 [gamma proteobacterium symbiont of Bathyaustriella thionipta]|nr:hypothetical protein [gamma proteobacterium symbiont of Bathyaustriella thionipta]
MSQENPYSSPSADLSNSPVDGSTLIPRKLPAARGVDWIKDAYVLFKANMGLWIGMILVFMIISIVLSMIPLVSIALTVLMPVFYGGILLGAKTQDEGGELEFNHLFAGFKYQTGRLAAVGGLYLAGLILIMVLMAVIIIPGGLMADAQPHGDGMNPVVGLTTLLGFLIGMSLSIPLFMAYWFAPALVVFHDQSAFNAMKLSFRACLKNILPFLLYGLLAMVLVILGMIPLFLGLLFVIPLLMLTLYTSYKDVFVV